MCKRTTIVFVSSDGDKEYEEIKSILALHDWNDQNDEILNLFSSDEVQLITITVTESGYYCDNDNNLLINAKDIQNDISNQIPRTIFGALARGLESRMESGGGPITIACCDNLQENGVMLEHCFIQYLNALNNEKLLNWVSENTSFPSSMVDRITPKIDLQELQEIQRMFNRQDDCSVFSEDFIQWVIEDNFAGIRPPLNEVGVEIVDDVEPYENTKIRILNGGHTVLAYLGVLEGYETFDSAIRDSELSDFFDGIQSEEIIPSLPINSPVDYERYLAMQAFKNNMPFYEPPLSSFDRVDSGEMTIMSSTQLNKVYAMIKLNNFDEYYLYAGRSMDGNVISALNDTVSAKNEYTFLEIIDKYDVANEPLCKFYECN